MSQPNEPKVITDDVVVSMEYILLVDGTIIDETEEGESLNFIQGSGAIIPGLEQALYGLAVGEGKSVRVATQDAYGEYDFEQIDDIPMSEFPEEIPLEPDVELEMTDNEGDILYGRIVSVGKSRVKVDFNHPLAGKDLEFDITILALRNATPEELEQGFVE